MCEPNKEEAGYKKNYTAGNVDAEVSSDALVADILNDLQKSQKPFSMDEIVKDSKKRKKHTKESKKHKKKKSKKSGGKHRHRSRSTSPSRRRRSRSGTRSRSRSRRSSSSRSRSRSPYDVIRKRKRSGTPVRPSGVVSKDQTVGSVLERVSSSDDDLPAGADYISLQSSHLPGRGNASTCQMERELPVDVQLPPVENPPGKFFPIAKEHRNSESPPPLRMESDILKKVIEEKGKPDLTPRNLKINIGKITLPVSSALLKAEPGKAVVGASLEASNGKNDVHSELSGKAEDMSEEDAKGKVLPTEEISEESLDGDVANGSALRKKQVKRAVRPRSLSSGSSVSRTTDELIRTKVKGRGSKTMQMHSERVTGGTDNRRARSPAKTRRRKRSRSRSSSRSRSRSRRRSRSAKRTRRSRSRSFTRSRSRDLQSPRSRDRRRRSRTRSRDRYATRGGTRGAGGRREKIDKQKLLEIAKKKARQLQSMGLMTASGELADGTGKSIDQLVEYCQRLSKREEKEARREKGEAVSSDSEVEDFAAKVKHPYDVKPSSSIPITINIANAVPLPVRSAQERMLDESTLRLCYPVSSGAIHKESTETEWQPVEKDPLPVTVTDVVKQTKAVTSLELQEARKTGVELPPPVPLLPPPPLPPSFDSPLPVPPVPPAFPASSSVSSLLPPPPLPPMIVPAPEEKIIIKEPVVTKKAPKDVAKVLAKRASATRRLEEDPNDYEARRDVKEADEQMKAWAVQGSLPGKFTGSTGLRVLSADELQPNDPRYNAWVKKDQFKVMRPVTTGVGMRLMQKMGWRPGEGLGKDRLGSLEPLQLDVKFDRKGLSASDENHRKKMKCGSLPPAPVGIAYTAPDLGTRNPVSLLMELCAKRRWGQPTFTFSEDGPSNSRRFACTIVVNGTSYSPFTSSAQKKAAKALACQVTLQTLGLIRCDPNLPIG